MPPGKLRTPATSPCRDCAQEVSASATSCPHCGASHPALIEFKGEGYEWKSRALWLGQPVIHIAFGSDARGQAKTARGILAIGQTAKGIIAIGVTAVGAVAIGVVAVGMFSVGVTAVGLGVAFGVQAIAPVAFGVSAIGYLVGGVAPFGWKIMKGA